MLEECETESGDCAQNAAALVIITTVMLLFFPFSKFCDYVAMRTKCVFVPRVHIASRYLTPVLLGPEYP